MKVLFRVKGILIVLFVLSSAAYSFAQSNTRMQFFPATQKYFAGLNVYNTNTAEFNQFYVKDGQWVKNNFIPQPKLSINGGNYRMTFIPAQQLQYPGLFVYSKSSGEFEMFYLESGAWKNNGLFPRDKILYGNSEMEIDFTPAQNGEVAYLTAYSVDGKQFGIYYVDGMKWVKSDLYP